MNGMAEPPPHVNLDDLSHIDKKVKDACRAIPPCVDVRFYRARGPMPGGEPGWKTVTVFCRSDSGLIAYRGILIDAERGTVVMGDGTPFPDSRPPAFYAELPE